jgi:hypothetical protein
MERVIIIGLIVLLVILILVKMQSSFAPAPVPPAPAPEGKWSASMVIKDGESCPDSTWTKLGPTICAK